MTEKDIIKMSDINIHGNIFDDCWFEHLKYDNGKPHLNAILILSEIVYWYRPTVVKDEQTGKVKGLQKKYKADWLQKDYQDFADKFGISKRQAKAGCDYLKDKGIINLDFRTIHYGNNGNKVANNVMFVDLVVDNLLSITGIKNLSTGVKVLEQQGLDTPPTSERKRVVHLNEGLPTSERKTNTYNTTKSTTNINNDNGAFTGKISQHNLSPFSSKVFNRYYHSYWNNTGDTHPKLSNKQLADKDYFIIAISKSLGIDDDIDAWQILIDKHFKTNYGKDIDYNINHFLTEGIIERRFYEELK